MKSLYMSIYDMALKGYFSVIRLLSPIHRKARLMTQGRRGLLKKLKERRDPDSKYVWIHAASLGEFEQGRPLIERLKASNPEYKICLTFFSPSGYEVRKDYPLADIVLYIPYDTSPSLRKFIDILSPEKAIFIKYEIWLHTLSYLKSKSIPTFLISAIFRPEQHFFRPKGEIFREGLRSFRHIFVQNEESARLLSGIGIEQVSITGDTRMDRVLDICANAKTDPIVETFAEDAHRHGKKVVIVGSSWEEDEDVYLPVFREYGDVRLIIVPHEITEKHTRHIKEQVSPDTRVLLHTEVTDLEAVRDADLLVVDRMGLLSSLYRYADIAYIGGGFGRGIHNTPEAAVYGVPVIFGPKYRKFMEAVGLIAAGGGFSVEGRDDLSRLMYSLLSDEAYRKRTGAKAAAYISAGKGSTEKVYNSIFNSH